MSLYIVDIHGELEGDYEIIKKYEEPTTKNNLGVDCIDRKALLNRLNDFNKWCKDGRLQGSMFAADVIGDMPSVTSQELRWIPVSERLPKEDGRYLVTVQNLTGSEHLDNNVFECEFFYTDWIFKGWKDNKVIAWMPLPEPYEPQESEEV